MTRDGRGGARPARRRWARAVVVATIAGACGGGASRDLRPADTARTVAALDAADNCGVITGYELTLGGLGAMRMGRPVGEIRRTCLVVGDDTTEEGNEDYPSRVLTVRTPRGDAAVLVDSGRVSGVAVAVPTLRTSDSLGVGTTLERLLRIDGTTGAEDDGGVFVAPGGRCGLNFSLAYDVPNQRVGHVWSAAELAHLPPSTRVRRVYATGATPCPGAPVVSDGADRDAPTRSAARAAADIPDKCGVATGYEFTEYGLGALRVGRPLAAIRRECIVIRDDTTGEGMDDAARRVLVVRTPRGEAELLIDDSARVGSISVTTAALRTSDSLGVGTTLDRLLRIPGTEGEQDEDGLTVVPGSRCGLRFRMTYREPTISLGHVWRTSELARLPPGTRVRGLSATAEPCLKSQRGDEGYGDPPE